MENRKEMLDALMRAMELEKETFDFYTKAEHKTFDPAGKQMFHWLARSEEQHYLKLSELYTSLDQSGRWVFYGGNTVALPELSAVSFQTDDREALQLAAEVERRGVAAFEALLAQTTDPDGRGMLETLLNEEREHLRIISEKLAGLGK